MFPLRDENPNHRFPFITVILIALNAVVFFHEIRMGRLVERFIFEYGILPVEVVHGANLPGSDAIHPYLTLFTSMFLHGGIAHFVGNMWFLWIFGDNIEDTLGHFGFLVFYLVTGLAAGLTHVVLNPASAVPTLGASGAISGVLGAYLVLFPRIRIQTLLVVFFFWQVVRVPAVFFLGLWFFLQLQGGLVAGSAGSGVAFGAHIGGFVAGVLLVFFFTRRPPRPTYYRYQPRRVRRGR